MVRVIRSRLEHQFHSVIAHGDESRHVSKISHAYCRGGKSYTTERAVSHEMTTRVDVLSVSREPVEGTSNAPITPCRCNLQLFKGNAPIANLYS